MTDTPGAITQAIEAAEETHKELRFWHRNSKDSVKTSMALEQSEKALEALKAFKEGVLDGLENYLIQPGESLEVCHLPMATSPVKIGQERIAGLHRAGKHLLDAIK